MRCSGQLESEQIRRPPENLAGNMAHPSTTGLFLQYVCLMYGHLFLSVGPFSF